MGQDISALGSTVVMAGTGIAAGVTFGQVKELNIATEECAKFTGERFMNSNVRHVSKLAGVSIAAVATLGQCEAINECLRNSAPECAKTLLQTCNDISNYTPVVGHVKGSIHYACGDKENGDEAMKISTRTTGVLVGGVGGFCIGGPVGAKAGAWAGAAAGGAWAGGAAGGAAMDGIFTGIDSATKGEYHPHGQIASWTRVIKNESPQDLVEGMVGCVTIPTMDAYIGASM